LGEAARAGLPLPPGFALSGAIVESVAGGEERAFTKVAKSVRDLDGPLAVRSSAVDEDGAAASFAGQHLTLLNVPSTDALGSALREIWCRRTPTRPSPTASASGSSRVRASGWWSRRFSTRRPPA
jgi:phosphoenolpyruvate synthase/pyruvate phosphate dikinase